MTISTRSYADARPSLSWSVRPAQRVRRMAFVGMLTASACVLGLVEASVPLPLPGVRLGFANIAVVLTLAICGPVSALFVSLARVMIVGIATASLAGPASIVSWAGAVCSWLVMAVLWRTGRHSLVGTSAAGAVVHVAAQFATVSVIVGGLGVATLATPAMLVGLAAGVLVGSVAQAVLSRVDVT